jgi:hypothetical protein
MKSLGKKNQTRPAIIRARSRDEILKHTHTHTHTHTQTNKQTNKQKKRKEKRNPDQPILQASK